MATIFLTVYGKEGIHELALHNLAKANYARNSFPVLAARGCSSPRLHGSMSLYCKLPNRPTTKRAIA